MRTELRSIDAHEPSTVAALEARLDAMLAGSPYQDYVYGYPHKTAYRPLTPHRLLAEAWRGTEHDALALYLHLPFCEMRCGFCNLFTATDPQRDLVAPYLAALRRQAEAVAGAIGARRFVRLEFGGGTPTFLQATELDGLFDLVTEVLGAAPHGMPVSVEASPMTATPDRLAVLASRGVDRLSLGVQSFDEDELKACGRAREAAAAERALDSIRAAGFATLNVDLIYGGEFQTLESWMRSVQRALAWAPEEIFLYPLYVRPLTGLAGRARVESALGLACYRAARDMLQDAGYDQLSMRMFRRRGAPSPDMPHGNVIAGHSASKDARKRANDPAIHPGMDPRIKPAGDERADVRRQLIGNGEDIGMVGLGCGARSYAPSLHYCTEYAVGRSGVLAILQDYIEKPSAAFAAADYGIAIEASERRRRFLLLSLMQCSGVDPCAYAGRFGGDIVDDFPELTALARRGLATIDAGTIVLTPPGLERSDVIGPWLYSAGMRRRMESYMWR
jgi:oxygen-independent coproporphyrinogen-3 oxidase